MLAVLSFLALFAVSEEITPEQLAAIEARANPPVIREAMLHPLFASPAMCTEHWAGQLMYLGDALGQDCMVIGGIEERGFASPYRTDGKTNEDWYGWGETVLAPVSGKIVKFFENPVVNTPGAAGTPPAQGLAIAREDGLTVVVAHLGSFSVAMGDMVEAGQPIGAIGNNGYGRAPHIHVAAFDKESALQIRWDLKATAALLSEAEDKAD